MWQTIQYSDSTVQQQLYYAVRSRGNNLYNAALSDLHYDYLSSHLYGLLAVGIYSTAAMMAMAGCGLRAVGEMNKAGREKLYH